MYSYSSSRTLLLSILMQIRQGAILREIGAGYLFLHITFYFSPYPPVNPRRE